MYFKATTTTVYQDIVFVSLAFGNGITFSLFLDHGDVIFTQFYSLWNDFGQGMMLNNDVDHFLADLAFFGVLAPPFFLGVLKSLSQTSHTHRPEEEDNMSD